ncbi:zinc finger CCCH domain-containing protein 15-like [Raphanus sativus]|uniref:Zinc finger CCCH domain-containing protein 15-like n=1 Tax=Raphanus sativus TaxID=3726 RepID=A0A9W3D217_RAPSA|nr:zinc finger CCCH domain-containing protein 15-like [Raphanus sativus]XP_056857809.1 zinc finger CCCH domain-containing protein 15-like [Raphanus sativus]
MENETAPFTYSVITSHGEPSVGGGGGGVVNQIYRTSSAMQQQRRQDMVNREALCYTRLHEASLEAEVLRLENTELRSMNLHLKRELDELIRSSVQNSRHRFGYDRVPLRMLSNLSIGDRGGAEADDDAENRNRAVSRDDVSEESPTSVIANEDLNRSSLPKSISVRSSGYSKASQGGGGCGGGGSAAAQCGKSRGVVAKPGACGQQLSTTQRVYVRGGKKEEEEEIEVEVYNQGMTKTELCNKWQETGTCPYGDHCQFAHGIKELRPVIRHPRYKTEVCRMVLAGDICPYGHRCHFRHSLSEQEKLVASAGCKPNNKSCKLVK